MSLDDDKTIRDGLTLEDDALPETRKALLVYHRDGLDVVGLDDDQTVVVGRSAPSDIQARSRRLSRQHARFELRDGAVYVVDLDSTNGTWLNGRRITEETPIGEDDEVTLGSVAITVQTLGDVEGRLAGLLPHERFVDVLDGLLVCADVEGADRPPLAVVMVRALGGRGRLSRWVPRVRDLLRLVDRVGIYGPDAIEILLPGGDRARAERLAEQIVRGRQPGEPELVCAFACAPHDGVTGERLVEAAREDLRATDPRKADQDPATPIAPEGDGGPVVRDPAMVELYRTLDRVASSNLSILVLGETGTGKEVVARSIHERSGRSGPLRSINCGAIPSTLLESVLFGHEKGAFTGADRQKSGVFEEANGGTVFLDEIGELSASAQVALLRVLETRRIQRVGSSVERDVDVRIVAATHRDLEAMCDEGTFRWDLLYRLNPITLALPPLRERPGEIRPLMERFVVDANAVNDRSVRTIAPDALAMLERYPWPGNVRELRNAVERAVVVAEGDRITVDDLPDRVRAWGRGSERELSRTPEPTEEYTASSLPRGPVDLDLKERVSVFEQQLIQSALRACGGNQTEAAALLVIPRRTFVYKLRSYGIVGFDPTAPPLEPAATDDGRPLDFRGRVERLEAQLVREALDRAAGDRTEAARLLGIQRRTLDAKCDRLLHL